MEICQTGIQGCWPYRSCTTEVVIKDCENIRSLGSLLPSFCDIG